MGLLFSSKTDHQRYKALVINIVLNKIDDEFVFWLNEQILANIKGKGI